MSNPNYTLAPSGFPCGWTNQGMRCSGNSGSAIHVLKVSLPIAPMGTALCPWHSPYEVKAGEREKQLRW